MQLLAPRLLLLTPFLLLKPSAFLFPFGQLLEP